MTDNLPDPLPIVVDDFIVRNCRGSGEKHYVMTPITVAKETTVEESMINSLQQAVPKSALSIVIYL